MVKKKSFILCFLLFVMLFFVGSLGNSNVFAYYPTTSAVSSGDIKNVCDTIGLSYTDTSLNSRATACNLLLTDKSANIGNIVFYTDGTNLYAILQSGSIGDTFPELAVYKNSLGNITVRQHNGFIFSGEEIIGVTPASNIKKYMLSPANGTYTESTGNIVIYGNISLSNSLVDVSTQICATWSANATASWDGYNNDNPAYDWRFLRPYVTLTGWVAPTSTPTPTPTPTSTPAGGGGTDLTDTNNKIDTVNSSVQEVKNVISGEAQEIKELISGETQEVISAITSPADFSGETITSGDINDSLGFEIMHDPFENFWLTLITGLDDCLTDSVRSITFTFFNEQYTIDLDTFNWSPPASIRWLLEMISTYAVILFILKYWKSLIDMLQSGSVDEVLQLNEEEGIVDMF